MALMTWAEVQCVIKVGFTDDAHKEVLNLLNELYDHVSDAAERSHIGLPLDTLISHVVDHFAHEEKEMMAKGFSAYDCHKEEHHKEGGTCAGLQTQFHAGNGAVTEEIYQVVENWLDSCIPVFDVDYTETLNVAKERS